MPNISDSFINSLMGLFPNITREENIHLVNRLGFTSDRMGSKTLYNIWRDQDNKISETLYKRPVTISDDEVQKMEKAGLVRQIANNLEVTEKGKNAIKVMVLGNDASIFKADDNNILDYDQSFAKTQSPEMLTANKKSTTKTSQSKWWGRFE